MYFAALRSETKFTFSAEGKYPLGGEFCKINCGKQDKQYNLGDNGDSSHKQREIKINHGKG